MKTNGLFLHPGVKTSTALSGFLSPTHLLFRIRNFREAVSFAKISTDFQMGRSPRQEKCLLCASPLSQSQGRLELQQPSDNHSELSTQVTNGGGFCTARGVSELSGPNGKMEKQCRCFKSKNPRTLVERMLKTQVCGKRSVCVIDNLHSQNRLQRLSSISNDPDLSGQASEILSTRYVQLGPHSGGEESWCMSS